MQTYKISYDYQEIAHVTIDNNDPKTIGYIIEMVQFWGNWQQRLVQNDGDYFQTWLKQLGKFILHEDRAPNDDEGWYPLDGSHGIKLVSWGYEIDTDSIEIMEVK